MTYVVYNPANKLYLKSLFQNANGWIWDEADVAHEFATLQEAEDMATSIGGGTVGTTKPK